jgi:hypothetical protein
MIETASFRIEENEARKYLTPGQGMYIGGGTRTVTVRTTDPLFERIGKLERALWEQRRVFLTSWKIIREYSMEEWRHAEVCRLTIDKVFEPCGEECGTDYDETKACAICGVGGEQTSALILNTKKIPHNADFARSIANELVVSEKVADAINRNHLTGAVLRPVRHAGKRLNSLPNWYHLIITSRRVPIAVPTRGGIDPFNDDKEGKFKCPLGHVAGLNLLSQLWLKRNDFDGSDITATVESFGIRKGLLRPAPALVISPRAREVFLNAALTGWKCEVAHLVNE